MCIKLNQEEVKLQNILAKKNIYIYITYYNAIYAINEEVLGFGQIKG